MMKRDYNKLHKQISSLLKNDNLKEQLQSILYAIDGIKRRDEVEEDWAGVEYPHITLKNVLNKIGLLEKTDDKHYLIDKDNPLLNYKIQILQDDGMGYGANNGYCFDAYEERENKNIKIWF